jgi:hypothetical protein
MILKAQHKQLLKRLEYKSSALKSFTHGDNGVGNVSVHYENYLNDLQNFGYVVSVDDVWHITGYGLAALQEKKVVASPTRIHNGTTTEFYDGADLKQSGIREGAFDFLKYPSKFGDNLVYRKVSI